jgi:signal peptidase I
MRRSNFVWIVVFMVSLSSCDFVKKTKELVFNRYKVSTPSMSPNFNVGETYAAFTSDSFQINQAVIYSPIKRLRIDNENVVYVHRLVGTPGDYLEMKSGELFLNNKPYPFSVQLNHSYRVTTTMPLNEKLIKSFDYYTSGYNIYIFNATVRQIGELKKNGVVNKIESEIYGPEKLEDIELSVVGNNRDNWGPVKIPKKGDRLIITEENQKQYQTIFSEHEGNKSPSIGDEIILSKDYYFVLGDNRHNALDSRYTGFIPHDRMKAYLVIDNN